MSAETKEIAPLGTASLGIQRVQDATMLQTLNVKAPPNLTLASANAKAEINPPEEIVAQVRGVEIHVVGVNVMNSYREVAHACQ